MEKHFGVRNSEGAPALRACRTACIMAFCAVVFATAAWAQTFPAGVQGTWKVKKQLLSKHGGGMIGPCPGGLPLTPGSRITIGEKSMQGSGGSAPDAHPELQVLSAQEFTQMYLKSGTLKDLGMSSAQIQTIKVSAPESLPADLVIIRSPSTLIFERCGLFYEAAHDSGFKAPPLPQQY